MAGKYKSWSPYNYVVGNPIFYTDPDGEDIRIHYQEKVTDDDGNETIEDRYVTYSIGMGYTGNSFVDNVIKSLNWLVDEGADVTDIIDDIAGNGAVDLVIFDSRNPSLSKVARASKIAFSGSTPYGPNPQSSKIRNGRPTVLFRPDVKMKFGSSWPAKRAGSEPQGTRNAAEALLHELGHAQSYFANMRTHRNRMRMPDSEFNNAEERRVINNIENPAARILRPNEPRIERTHHGGYFVKASSPITIE